MPNVLIVDDDPAVRRVLERLLRERSYGIEAVESGEAGLAAVQRRRPDLVLLDLHMGGIGGMQVLARLTREAPGVPVVIMTGSGSIEAAVDAFKLGAVDFVTKPFDERKLLKVVEALLPIHRETAGSSAPTMVGESPRFRETMDLALKFARPDINVLLEGETGTGKELFARAIHAASKRRAGPFVPVDCSILSEGLIEAELFGHEKGSFTGATASRIGHFERADGGTLFLDEIGNLSMPFQAKLLRVLQERTIERVGGRETLRLDVRVVSATNVDLREAIRANAFRKDLYYRLGEFTIRTPPLRDREGDVERIAEYFVHRYAGQFGSSARGIAPAALERLVAHTWPGNVRELENAIKGAVILAEDLVQPEHLPPELGLGEDASTEVSEAAGERLRMAIELDAGQLDLKALATVVTEKAERAVLEAVLKQKRYGHGELAKMMNVDPKTLRAKLRKYGLDSAVRGDWEGTPAPGESAPGNGSRTSG